MFNNIFLAGVSSKKLLIVSLISLSLVGCDASSKSEMSEPVLRFVKVLTISSPLQYQFKEFPGVVDAAQKAELGFRVSGQLEKLLVKEGDFVEKGQLLAQLDGSDYQIKLNSSEAEYKQEHDDYLRGKKLVVNGVISRSDFSKLEAKNSTSLANLNAAKQAVTYTFLRAPFAGQVAKRRVENFEEVAVNQPVYLLQDISSLSIKVNIPASLMIQTNEKTPPKLSAVFDSIPGQSFPLTIKEVSTQADEATNTYQVTLGMESVTGYNVLPGMSVTVRGRRSIDQGTNNVAFYVPASAVLGDEKGQYVYLAKPTSDGLATAEMRRVETGRISQAGLEILSGVSEGEALIVAGMSKMYEGLEVRLSRENAL